LRANASDLENMLDIVETLQNTTRLVKMCGQSRLSDGRTLAGALTLDGIPFWDAFPVELGRIYIPTALSNDPTASSMRQKSHAVLDSRKIGFAEFFPQSPQYARLFSMAGR
jgi:hypothetical protein